MSGFFRTDFSGAAGTYSGAAAIVNGKVAALDTGGGQLHGTYKEADGRLTGSIVVSVPGGGTLASGAQVGSGQGLTVPFDVSKDALDGHTFELNVGGAQIRIRLTKIADL